VGELNGKIAVITGGASGIGERSVRLFVEEGARVVIADMQRERGEALAAELKGAAVFAEVEVRQEEQVKAAIDVAVQQWGRLDCIFNNAGFGGVIGPVEATPVDEFDMTFDVRVRGVFLGMKHAAPIMKQQRSGSIINTGSVAGIMAGYSPHAYAAAKAAVLQLTKSVAMELGEHQIRVNAICPGWVETPLIESQIQARADRHGGDRQAGVADLLSEKQPSRRLAQPTEIGALAVWLCDPKAHNITGAAIPIDGGWTAQ
jgi:NAD(P)-dependent dehydrogenase (short-subunit alcohol dehydrogenase family)